MPLKYITDKLVSAKLGVLTHGLITCSYPRRVTSWIRPRAAQRSYYLRVSILEKIDTCFRKPKNSFCAFVNLYWIELSNKTSGILHSHSPATQVVNVRAQEKEILCGIIGTEKSQSLYSLDGGFAKRPPRMTAGHILSVKELDCLSTKNLQLR